MVLPVGVRPDLGEDDVRPEPLKQRRDHRLESGEIDLIVRSGPKGQIDVITLSRARAYLRFKPCPGEKRCARFMERNCQHPVGRIKGILDAVAVMHVYIDGGHPQPLPHEVGNRARDVVHVAKTGGMVSFRVVEAAYGVEDGAGLPLHERHGPDVCAPGNGERQIEHALKNGVLVGAQARPEHLRLKLTPAGFLEQLDIRPAVEQIKDLFIEGLGPLNPEAVVPKVIIPVQKLQEELRPDRLKGMRRRIFGARQFIGVDEEGA